MKDQNSLNEEMLKDLESDYDAGELYCLHLMPRLINQAREANRLRRVVQMIIDKEQNGEPSWSRRILEESAYAALETGEGKDE